MHRSANPFGRGKRAFVTGLLAMAMLLGPGFVATLADAGADRSTAVDINRATIDELMEVKGIGEVIAQRIVDFREKNGPYETVDDLLKVRGIGELMLDRIRDSLSARKPRR